MRPIAEVYPDKAKEEAEDGSFYGPGSYQPMLESLGFEIVLQVDDSDYQGDSRLLFRDGGRFGFLVFGWGSCSGCDALQACDSMQEIDELRTGLYAQIEWHDSATACLERFESKDWETEYSYHADETKEFVERAKQALREVAHV